MSATRSSRINKSYTEPDVSDQYMSPPPKSRKRSASLQSVPSSDPDAVHDVSDTIPPKRLKKADPGSPQFDALSPVNITNKSGMLRNLSRKLSFEASDVEVNLDAPLQDDFLVVEEPSNFKETSPPAASNSKRVRRPTEKSLYNSRENPRKVVKDEQVLPKSSEPKSRGDHGSRSRHAPAHSTEFDDAKDSRRNPPKERSRPTVVKMELPDTDQAHRSPTEPKSRPVHGSRSRRAPLPNIESDNAEESLRKPPSSSAKERSRSTVVKTDVDTDQALRSPYTTTVAKGKRSQRFASPIDVSSDECDPSTPMGNTGKRNDVPETMSPRNLTRSDEGRIRKSDLQLPSDTSHPVSVLSSPRKPTAIDPEKNSADTPVIPGESASLPAKEVYLEDLVLDVQKTSFVLVPFDNGNGPTSCPSYLLHTNDDGSTSPIELVAGAFSLFDGAAFNSIASAMRFKELRPFVNVTAVPRDQIYAERYKHHVMWQGRNRSVLFTMLGSVQSCRLVEPTTIGQHLCKAITVIPFGEAWRKFHVFLGKLYGQGQMRGPFEYGCLLTLSGRREGYSTPDASSALGPVTPKKNSRAFGGSSVTAASEWFDGKIPNCVDFDKTVPIYDASKTPFLFTRDDFIGMPSLPLYKRHDKLADLPVDSIVSVFFAMSSYPKRSGSSGPSSGPASFNDILSLNIHFVIYYGVIP